MQNLETRMEKYEKQLNTILSRLDQLSGQIAAFRGNANIFHKEERGYLKNITRQMYEIKTVLDMSTSNTEYQEQKKEGSNIQDKIYLKNITKQIYEIKKALDMSEAYKECQKEWEDDSYFG